MSPLDEIDDFLGQLIEDEDNEVDFNRVDQGYMQWLKYPEILKWLPFYLITEFHSEEYQLPPRKIDLDLCEKDFYHKIETQFPNSTFYIIIKYICLMYHSNWIKLYHAT